jgi:hypothetical protein
MRLQNEEKAAKRARVYTERLDRAAFQVASKATDLRDNTAFCGVSSEDWDLLLKSIDVFYRETGEGGGKPV